jgi:hypothetical protein
MVFTTKQANMCCWSRWWPAGDDVAGCRVPVTATGQPQTITITGGLADSNLIDALCTVEFAEQDD